MNRLSEMAPVVEGLTTKDKPCNLPLIGQVTRRRKTQVCVVALVLISVGAGLLSYLAGESGFNWALFNWMGV